MAGYSKSGQMTGPFRHFDMKGSVLTGNSIKVKRDAEGSPLPQLLGVSSFDGSKLTTLERNNILVQVLTLTQLSTYSAMTNYFFCIPGNSVFFRFHKTKVSFHYKVFHL